MGRYCCLYPGAGKRHLYHEQPQLRTVGGTIYHTPQTDHESSTTWHREEGANLKQCRTNYEVDVPGGIYTFRNALGRNGSNADRPFRYSTDTADSAVAQSSFDTRSVRGGSVWYVMGPTVCASGFSVHCPCLAIRTSPPPWSCPSS